MRRPHGDPRGRRGAAARSRRQPRARQRAGADRLGGLRDGDPGGRRGRRHHDRGHAAELHPADDRRGGVARSSPSRRGRWPSDVAFWGGAVPGNAGELRPMHEAGRRGVQVLPARQRGPRVPAAGPTPGSRCARRARRLRRAADRALPRTGVIAAAPEPTGRELRGLPGLPAARGGRGVGHRGLLAPPGDGRTGHVVHLADADALPLLRRRGPTGCADHRRDLPALSDLRCGAGAGRCDRVQVLPADPRGRAPRGAVGRPCGTATSTSS